MNLIKEIWKNAKWLLIVWAVGVGLVICFWSFVGYIAWHFITKFW